MTIDKDDIHADEQFYAAREPITRHWELFDCGEVTHTTNSMAEMKAFVHGLWRGMAIYNTPDLTCTFYSETGVNLDTLVSKELLNV